MLKPKKFDVETIEPSGITALNDLLLCLVCYVKRLHW